MTEWLARVGRRLLEAALLQQPVGEDIKDERSTLVDGIVFVLVATPAITFVESRDLLTTGIVTAAVVPALFALGALLWLTMRINRGRIRYLEATASLTITTLPLLLVMIPTVGPFVGVIWWLVASMSAVRHVTLDTFEKAFIAVLLAAAIALGAGFTTAVFL